MKIDYVINLIPQQRTRARFAEIERIKHLAAETKTKFQNIENLPSLNNIYFKIDNFPEYRLYIFVVSDTTITNLYK